MIPYQEGNLTNKKTDDSTGQMAKCMGKDHAAQLKRSIQGADRLWDSTPEFVRDCVTRKSAESVKVNGIPNSYSTHKKSPSKRTRIKRSNND